MEKKSQKFDEFDEEEDTGNPQRKGGPNKKNSKGKFSQKKVKIDI
jgi:hypothetical protein